MCAQDALPWLSVAEMRAIDDVAVGELGIELKQMMENAGRNLAVLARMLLGYSQSGAPRGEAARLIAATASARVVALDIPSGLELATGVLREPHVRAEATMTLAAPKAGLRASCVAAAVGDLYAADISVQSLAFERIGVRYSTPFSELVRVV